MENGAPPDQEAGEMSASFVSSKSLPEFSLWEKMESKRALLSFDLEVTARCNNNCRHCYINLPAGDKLAEEKELALEEIKEIANEAVSLGALWCLITGGEPLLRNDFFDIYLTLKRKGLLVSVFTNGTLITEEHVKLFKKYPPRDIEVSVYGVTEETYERVTRRPGSYAAFMRGLELLLGSGVKLRLKAMAMRSNMHELADIAHFCRRYTKDYFRFDPLLHLRYDGAPLRNAEIRSERLTPDEIVTIERADKERFTALKRDCAKLINTQCAQFKCGHLFHCSAGNRSFALSYDGLFRLCPSLWHPDCVYDLRKGNLTDAWQDFVPMVREMRSDKREYLEKCGACPLINLCMWCPAHAHLETGVMDAPVDIFCNTAHARAETLGTKERATMELPLTPALSPLGRGEG
jgi:radical SAM protein with 4Fe4S-binding SPASM domain